MVMRFGMSEKLGPRVFGHDGQPFLGREFSSEPDYSDEIARDIDAEINRIVAAAYQQASEILVAHRDRLETISRILVDRETIDADQFQALLAGESAADVFGPDEPAAPAPSIPPAARRSRLGRPLALPRPGFAGGAAALSGEA